MQRAFVIGGTGMIGRTLLADLRSDCAAGAVEVRAGIRSPGHAAALAAPGTIPVPLDLDDRLVAPDRLIDAMRGSQTLFLLTGYTVDMLAQSKAAIDAARVAGIEHIVHLGLYAAAGTTGIHQGWHQLIETYIEASGMAWTHLQPNWFMSNFQNFQMATGGGRAETGGTIVLRGFLAADKRVSWIDADDIARAAAAVIRDPTRHKSKAYRLATEALSFGEVIDLARGVFGEKFAYEQMPLDILADALDGNMEPAYAASALNTIAMLLNGMLPECADTFDDYRQATGKIATNWRDMILRRPEWFGMG